MSVKHLLYSCICYIPVVTRVCQYDILDSATEYHMKSKAQSIAFFLQLDLLLTLLFMNGFHVCGFIIIITDAT